MEETKINIENSIEEVETTEESYFSEEIQFEELEDSRNIDLENNREDIDKSF